MKRRTSQDGNVNDCNNAVQQQQQQQQDNIDDNDGVNIFSKALLNLSFNDRNMIEEEIHGVSCMAIEETPELIEESLHQFDLELDLIENKAAYNKAKEIVTSKEEDPSMQSYLLSKDNKLRFLRCEFFDPRKSASRYTKFIDLLFDVYGECALRRPIRLQDFDPEELSFFNSGQYQLLPHRDRGGRRILAIVSNKKYHVPTRFLMKVFVYLWFVCAGGCDTSNNDRNNVETQRKGVIIVYFPNTEDLYNCVNQNIVELENDDRKSKWKKSNWKERMIANGRIGKVVPIRVAAVHICLPNSHLFKVVANVFGMASKALNVRTKIHLGHPTEIRYKLQQYGIPIELIPSTDAGNIKSVNFKQWMKLRTHLEHEEQTSGLHIIVECPLSNDVIFRSGKAMNFHAGNVKFQNLIESHIYEHSIDPTTPQFRRREIEIELMNEVLEKEKKCGRVGGGDTSGGRFLTWNMKKKWWSVIHSDHEIIKKINCAFRDFLIKLLKPQQQQQKVQTVKTVKTSNSLFERQQDGQKKKRYNDDNKDICCSDCGLFCGSDDNKNGCNSMPCLPSTINDNGNNSKACEFSFPSDDGSYANLNDGRLSSPK